MIWHVERRPRLIDRHTRLEAREEIDPIAAPVVEAGLREARLQKPAHRDRNEHVRRCREGRPVEAARRDADDRHHLAVDGQRLVQHVRIAREPLFPPRVAQHRHVRFADAASEVDGVRRLHGRRSVRIEDGGELADLIPTALDLLGLVKPAEMTGRSLSENSD